MKKAEDENGLSQTLKVLILDSIFSNFWFKSLINQNCVVIELRSDGLPWDETIRVVSLSLIGFHLDLQFGFGFVVHSGVILTVEGPREAVEENENEGTIETFKRWNQVIKGLKYICFQILLLLIFHFVLLLCFFFGSMAPILVSLSFCFLLFIFFSLGEATSSFRLIFF